VITKKKTSGALMGNDYEKNIQDYNSIFPNKRLDHGKPARSSIKNVEKAFKWFFENFDYDWDTVHKATSMYVHDREINNWKFTKTSQYFIRKNYSSDLADFCEIVLSGGEEDQGLKPIKVV
jgi:hypothetical protein